jgi:hypothetical protein
MRLEPGISVLVKASSNLSDLSKLSSRPLLREGPPALTKPQLSYSNKVGLGPQMWLDIKIDWPTDRRPQREFEFDLT